MWNKLKAQMKDIRVLVLNIIIVVLVFLLIIRVIMLVGEFSDSCERGYKEESFVYRMQDESYMSMVEMYHTNAGLQLKSSKEAEEYYGVAQYYEAASYYKIFFEAGDVLRMEKYLQKMNEASEKMGELGFVTEKIDARLGIE
ncbi:MAG: hypothetical protein ACI4R5_09455 [Acetatifactor sp.]